MSGSLTAASLRAALDYDPASGVFRWRISPNRRIVIGSVAGTVTRGRRQIKLFGRTHRSHRLAWLHFYGSWPEQEIDHRSGDATDNRISNLRDASTRINRENQRRAHRRSQVGILGVSRVARSSKFRARINRLHLGTFPTTIAAQAAYITAKRLLHEGGEL